MDERTATAQERLAPPDGVAGRPSVEQLDRILGTGTPEAVEANSQMLRKEKPIIMAISASAAETLRCLFFHGPTWDGNVPSKQGRDELVDMQLAVRRRGWQSLTIAGLELCLENGIHVEKESREARERQRRNTRHELARRILDE